MIIIKYNKEEDQLNALFEMMSDMEDIHQSKLKIPLKFINKPKWPDYDHCRDLIVNSYAENLEIFLLEEESGEYSGYFVLDPNNVSNFSFKGCVDISSVYFKEAYRKKKYLPIVLQYIKDNYSKTHEHINLNVFAMNEDAIGAYEKCGFKPICHVLYKPMNE